MSQCKAIGLETTMTEHSTSRPPRLLPDQPFPAYAYIPGNTPHPTRDPDGHSYGAELEIPEPPDPEQWRACRDYLYGIDLFNHGFYWEAHEAWEGLWVACGRRGPTATYLQALINLAAAGLKARSGSARGMRANAGKAVRLFESVARHFGSPRTRYMGLDVRALADYAGTLSKSQQTKTAVCEKNLPAFDLPLWPD
jgi:predicted metal-dependent hydrolase